MKKILWIVLLFGIMMFSACNKAEESLEPTLAPTQTPITERTPTSTPVPTEAPTATPEPTVKPTQVPTPSPMNTPTPTPTELHSKRNNIPFENNQLYAVAYLGYGVKENMDYYWENYLDEKELPNYFFSGAEYYLIIPRYEDMEVRLYRNDLATMGKTLEQECEAGDPFIVQCNISDIFPDVTVELNYNGEIVEFSPYISLKDGSVQVGERGLNITKSPEICEPDLQLPNQSEEMAELLDDGWISLTEEEIRWFNEGFFNVDEEIRKNNFLNCVYTDVKSISIYDIFYNFSEEISAEERESLRGSEIDCGVDYQKLTVAFIDGILREYMNVSFEEIVKIDLDFYLYLEEFDAYFGSHGDTNYSRVEVKSGVKDADGTVKLRYLRTEDEKEYIVTLEAHPRGYYFKSNVETQ